MTDPDPTRSHPTLRDATRVWALIGLQSFGGPAGQIAVMHRVLVDEKKWLSEARFLHALNFCMLLPGPEAMQLATYAGWLMHRTLGGLIAGLLFILPGFLSILALSLLYVGLSDLTVVQGLFFGLKPAVLAIVVQAVIKIGRRALKNRVMIAVAAASFLAIFAFNLPFPLIIASAAILGLVGARFLPRHFLVIRGHAAAGAVDDSLLGDTIPDHARPNARRTATTLTVWLGVWLVPVLALHLTLGPGHIFTKQSVFFSTAAVVTFGGAYSVLAFIAQQAVEVYAWLQPGEMLDGLGMAETTPGPLIQVVQFVGFMGAYRDPGTLNPYAAATLASVIVTWVTFAPCFLWIFVGAPFIESLRSRPTLTGALSAITAAVVGVILNLAVWFAVHTLFGTVTDLDRWAMKLPVPVWSTLDWRASLIAVVAFVLIFRFKRGMLQTLGVCAALGILLTVLR